MVILDRNGYPAALEMYRSVGSFFPLIAAVLLNDQDGLVYADSWEAPRQVYVEHSFGFAQIFGGSCPDFESWLERYLIEDKRFSAPKVRLYTPCLPAFLDNPEWNNLRSFRQRFFLDPQHPLSDRLARMEQTGEFDVVDVNERNVLEIESTFGVVSRFWRDSGDFVRKANPVAVRYRGRPASICYSAAEACGRVEIDVFTLPELRGLGAGKYAVLNFLAGCREKSLEPLWDCFSNNTGSIRLCRSVGFHASRPPYPFFTINR